MRNTISDVLDIWYAEHAYKLKDAKNVASISKGLVTYFGADTPVDNISTTALHKYVARHDGTLAPATLKRNLGVLKRALLHYERQGGVVRAIDWPKLRVTARSRHLTEEEQADLVYGTKDMVQFLIVLLLDTGMRLGEAQELRWSDVDLDKEVITLHRPKTGTTTVLPMSQRLVNVFKSEGARFSLETERKPDDWRVALPYQWGSLVRFVRHAISKMNHINEKNQAPEHVRHGKITIHTLRDTFATNMLRRGLAIQDVSYLLGHSNIQQTMKYAHVIPNDAVGRARKLLNGE
jgi:integrase